MLRWQKRICRASENITRISGLAGKLEIILGVWFSWYYLVEKKSSNWRLREGINEDAGRKLANRRGQLKKKAMTTRRGNEDKLDRIVVSKPF